MPLRASLRAWLMFAIAAMCSLFLLGCAPDRAVMRDRLVVSILTDPKTFNPALVSDAGSGTVLGPVFNSLLSSHGVTAELRPELAETWQILDNGLRIVFRLRENLKWSDGQPLTVEDVLFSFQDVVFNEKIPTSTRDVLKIGKEKKLPDVAITGDREITFTVPEPFAPFLRTVGSVEILPKHILAPTLANTDSDGNPAFLETWTLATPVTEIVGSGPYVFAEYRPSERFVYKRNPYYWQAPKPYIETLVFQIVESADTSLLQFRSGSLDVYSLRGEDFQLLKKEDQRGKFTIYNGGPATGQLFVMFNLNKGRDPQTNKPFVEPFKSRWFNEVKFRQAIAYAIDRQRMVTNIFRGLGDLQNSPISTPSPYFLSEKEGLKAYEYNPDKAKQLLQAAGFRYDSNGRLRDSDNNLVRFTLLTNAGSNPVRGSIGAQIKSDLDNIGITVDFTGIDFNILLDKLDNSKQWDAIILGFTGGIEPHSGFNLWATDGNLHMFNKGPEQGLPDFPGREIADWEQKLEDLMIRGAQEIDETKRKAVYAEFQQTVQEYLPLIHLIVPYSLSAVRDRVEGVEYSALGGALWNLESLQLSE